MADCDRVIIARADINTPEEYDFLVLNDQAKLATNTPVNLSRHTLWRQG